jgi:hypothetical protein
MLYQQLNDKWMLAFTLAMLGLSTVMQSQGTRGWDSLTESVSLARIYNDPWQIGVIFGQVGSLMLTLRGIDAEVRTILAEALRASQELEHPFLLAQALHMMGMVALAEHNPNQAQVYFVESLTYCQTLGDRLFIAVNLRYLGKVAQQQGNYSIAHARLTESLACCRENGSIHGMLECIADLATLAAARGQLKRAVHLWAAVEAQREASDISKPHQDSDEQNHTYATVRPYLDETDFVTACAVGQAMSLEQAITYALNEDN